MTSFVFGFQIQNKLKKYIQKATLLVGEVKIRVDIVVFTCVQLNNMYTLL